ncbi:hypothetical protein [Streptomyces sp. NPDC006510]|uniref:hypothetical protein n=1 Tax=Streptomyces sp. NPDC006510 TaxID=3155600 RepID=UPI0033B4B908
MDVARALAAIHGAVAGGTEMSRTRDTGPAAGAALDYSLSPRALIAVSARSMTSRSLIARRLAALAHSGLKALDEHTMRAVVRQAVRDVRTGFGCPILESRFGRGAAGVGRGGSCHSRI